MLKIRELFCFLCPQNNGGDSEITKEEYEWKGFLEELFWCPTLHEINFDLVVQGDNSLEGMESQWNDSGIALNY